MEDKAQLKKKTIFGAFWKFSERMIAQMVSLVVSVILARLLTPDDYSVVGIVAIFFVFANTLISGGFNTALIQKKDADKEDYSSVLFISLFVSAFIYILLFVAAPWIASIYHKDILVSVFRVMGITLFINAFKSVVCAYISAHLQFRKFFFATIVGTVVSAIVGIVMAMKGYGPWALVAQQMTNSVVDTFILYLTTHIKFVFKISKQKTKGLFKYGWKILVASEISVLYDEMNPLIIGLKYSSTDLSFYTKGKSFPSLINSSVGSTLSAVLFPTITKVQDNKEAMLKCIRRFMQIITFIIFPVMIGFLVIAENFLVVLLTEKWISATIYLQTFCIVYMFDMIQVGNLQVIRAVGRSDIVLILEIIKKVLYFMVILLFVLFTNRPEYLAIACIINTFIATIVNTFPNRNLIGYAYKMQILDILPNLLNSIIMGVIVYCISFISIVKILLLALQIVVGMIVYILLSIITKNKNFYYLFNTIKEFIRSRKQEKKVNADIETNA